jgi:hypothetical protein
VRLYIRPRKGIDIDGAPLSVADMRTLAHREGFEDWSDMIAFFDTQYPGNNELYLEYIEWGELE